MPTEGIAIMNGIGRWMKQYGEAIYKTRICAPYKQGDVAFTQNETNIFAFVLTDGDRAYDEVLIPYQQKVSQIELMNTGKKIRFEQTAEGIKAEIDTIKDEIALVFKMQ